MTSQFRNGLSAEDTQVMDTLNTGQFNSRVYNSVQEPIDMTVETQPGENPVFADLTGSKVVSIQNGNHSQELSKAGQ